MNVICTPIFIYTQGKQFQVYTEFIQLNLSITHKDSGHVETGWDCRHHAFNPSMHHIIILRPTNILTRLQNR